MMATSAGPRMPGTLAKRVTAAAMVLFAAAVAIVTGMIPEGIPRISAENGPWWILLGLLFVTAQLAYCRLFAIRVDWLESGMDSVRNAWIVWGFLFLFLWIGTFRWLPPHPAGLAEFVLGGSCWSAVFLGAAGLVGPDLGGK